MLRRPRFSLSDRGIWWGLVVAWLGVIWQFGESQVLPLDSSGEVLLLRGLARKGLYLVVYGVLGGLLFMALGPRRGWGWVFGLCLLVAVADELHQGFVPQRGFRLGDVGIDLVGGALGAVLARLLVGRFRRVAEDRVAVHTKRLSPKVLSQGDPG